MRGTVLFVARVSPSDHEQPGLRLRLAHEARRIATQHAYLDALEATTRRALERGTAHEIAEALRGFEGALASHFALEEQVHFPALHGLHADLGDEIGALERDHDDFHATLGEMRSDVAAAAGDGVRDGVVARFAALGAALRAHESREEALFARSIAR